MIRFDKTLFGFVSIFLSSLLWPSLPNISLIAFASLVLILVAYFKLSAKATGMLLGFVWVSVVGQYYTHSIANHDYFSQSMLVQGKVLNLQQANVDNVTQNGPIKLNLRLSKIGNNSFSFYPFFLRPKIRISWYNPSFSLSQGDNVQLLVKLKPAVGLANEGGFNYQKWLVSQGISATGYVKKSPSNKLISHHLTKRQLLVNHLENLQLKNGRFIHALSYGDRRFLTDQDWNLLQNTGTAHLFAISGMHLATVFAGCLLVFKSAFKGLTYFLVLFNAPLIITKNFKKLLLLVSLLACLIYSNLAGNQIPVMRAWLTLCLIVLLLLSNKNWRKTSIILAMLSLIVILYPLSILSLSFWFSLIAVCLIIIFVWRFPLTPQASFKNKVYYALKLQIFLSITTLPLILIFFNTLPFSALLANALMIPITTFLLLPLCLLGSLFTVFSIPTGTLYFVLDMAFETTLGLLYHINRNSEFYVDYVLTEFFSNTTKNEVANFLIYLVSSPFLYILAFVILLPPIIYKKFMVLASSLVLILYIATHDVRNINKAQKWRFIAFDVGQGSAHIIQSGDKTVLYDTGMGNSAFSMAKNVLIPYFEYKNITSLEYVFISHYDNDHSGGLNDIKQAMGVTQVIDPSNFCNRSTFVSQQKKDPNVMQLGGVSIEILWPINRTSVQHNNHSCVVKVTDSNHSILLTGDIEHKAESELVEYYKGTHLLKSDIIVAPHHGSKSSSSEAFIEAVDPSYVVFSAGYRNRWGFPHQEVLKRYTDRKIQAFHTGNHGQIIFSFSSDRKPFIEVETYRHDINPKWYNEIKTISAK